MYPQVKVREHEDTVTLHEEETSFLIRVTESLSLEGHSSTRTPTNSGRSSKSCPVSKFAKDRNSENHPPLTYAKDSKSFTKSSPLCLTSPSKGSTSRVGEDNRTNNRSSLVSRPRAVLSSPDNDDLIGNQNLQLEEKNVQQMKQSANQQSQKKSTNRNSQYLRKTSHKHARAESPLRRSKPPAENHSSSNKKLPPVCTK
ncbi:uncharacterized protein [Typha latifolia]|uniref:uncharacterized protein n=1 Tax=Typha latifolia TaxID=4733 RepID=UPI003C2C38F2